jgi:branched-chain amino acid transport system substrate-binding protein
MALLAVLLLGAPAIADAQGGTANTVKLGALLTLSGPLAAPAKEIRDAIDLAVEDVNRDGGLRSLGGARLEVIYGDSQARPDLANSETERLISQENVLAVMDMYPSATTLAASQVAERLKTPFYAAVSVADITTERGFSHVFQQVPRANSLVTFQIDFLDFLARSGGTKLSRVAIVTEDGDYGQSIAADAQAQLKARGYEVVGAFSYPFRTTDVSTMMAKVKAANPQAVIQGSYLGDSILISRAAARLGLKVPFIDAGGKGTQSYIDAVGKGGEGEFVLKLWNKDISPLARALNDRYRAKTGKDLQHHPALLYQAVLTLRRALENAGRADREALTGALRRIDIGQGPDLVLPYARIRFNEKGLIDGGGFLITQITEGDYRTVFPERFAVAKPVPGR